MLGIEPRDLCKDASLLPSEPHPSSSGGWSFIGQLLHSLASGLPRAFWKQRFICRMYETDESRCEQGAGLRAAMSEVPRGVQLHKAWGMLDFRQRDCCEVSFQWVFFWGRLQIDHAQSSVGKACPEPSEGTLSRLNVNDLLSSPLPFWGQSPALPGGRPEGQSYCELADMGTGNWIPVLCQKNMHPHAHIDINVYILFKELLGDGLMYKTWILKKRIHMYEAKLSGREMVENSRIILLIINGWNR